MSILDAVSAHELFRHLRAVSAEARLSGTPEEAQAFDYIEEQLRGFGYDVNRYESDALIGYPGTSSLEVMGTDGDAIPCNGYSLSPSTGADGRDR